MKFEEYLEGLRGKSVAVIGLGVSNRPLMELLLSHGAHVIACDKKTELGEYGESLKQRGCTLKLGEDYLTGIHADVIFRTPGLRPDAPGIAQAVAESGISANLSVVVSFTHVLPVIYAGVMGGIADTDPQLLEMARVYRLPLIKRLRYIWLPGVFPSLCESCIAAMGMCWKSGVSAEVIGLPDHSVGDALYRAKITLSTPDVFAWTLVIVLLSALLSAAAARVLRWLKARLCGEVKAV